MLDPHHGQPALRLTGGAHGPAADQPKSRPTRGLDPWRGAARVRTWGNGGSGADGRRNGEARPKKGRGGAHGVVPESARLTDKSMCVEEQRRGGATTNGCCGWRHLSLPVL